MKYKDVVLKLNLSSKGWPMNISKCVKPITFILKPFTIIPKIKYNFLVFILIIILGGHFGIVTSLLRDLGNANSSTFFQRQFSSGVFFNMAIAFLVSAICPVLIEFIDDKNIKFRGLKLTAFAFSFVIIIISIIFLATIDTDNTSLILPIQAIFYLVSLLSTSYLFILPYLKYDYDNFIEYDDAKRGELSKVAKDIHSDNRGVKS